MPDADVAVRTDFLVELHPVRVVGLIAVARVGHQLLERPPVLHVRRQAEAFRSEEAAVGPRGDLRDHLRHGREEPQIFRQFPPAVDPRADDEDDEVTFDRGSDATIDRGHRREYSNPARSVGLRAETAINLRPTLQGDSGILRYSTVHG
ncbi:MAG TPA: hypothetical protein VKE96_23200 [Vicinamibacterales bacterium]|nr:hypothetical protein [Vicinamibacterales bacterium]